MARGFTGIAFPFHFSAKGGVAISTTSPTDFSHIRESISQIIRTQVGERVMETDFGTDSLSLLFEPLDVDASLLSVAKYNITKALNRWERRIKVNNVIVEVDKANAMLLVTIDYTVIQTQMSDTYTVSVKSSIKPAA